MSEKLAAIRPDGGEAGIREHHLTRVLAGDFPSAAVRLADALEHLGYRVLSREPLLARRPARGWAAWYVSTNVLNYPISVAVTVAPVNPGTTRATFLYTLKHPLLSGSGRQTLTREAESVVALAALRANSSKCVACGAEALTGTRFCRRCGTPSVAAEPAELEVLTVTAAACSAFHRAAVGTVFLCLSLLAVSLSWLLAGGVSNLLGAFSLALGLFGLLMSLNGLRRLYRTVNPVRGGAFVSAARDEGGAEEARSTSPLPRREQTAFDDRTTALLTNSPQTPTDVALPRNRDGE